MFDTFDSHRISAIEGEWPPPTAAYDRAQAVVCAQQSKIEMNVELCSAGERLLRRVSAGGATPAFG
jgi:hypothetical protein